MRDGRSWRRWTRVFRPDPATEVDEELRHHIERRVEEYVAGGMDREAAREAALERLGDLTHVRDQCAGLLAAERRAEKRRWLANVSILDVKLGVRMLLKYPGLSLVSVVGMAVAIAIAAGGFGFIGGMLDPTLPLADGDRVVSLQNNRADNPGNPDRQSLHDFVLWRDELSSVRDLGAFRMGSRNLVSADGSVELVRVAEITASGFRVARVPPLLGRPLIEDDEGPGALPALVISEEEWRERFDGDPGIIGRTVRLGQAVHTVVGVMPAGYRFPLNHRFWIPLRLNPSDHERGGGPAIHVFGRLADGVTLGQARAELAVLGRRTAAAYPATHEHLRPAVLPYTHPFLDIDSPAMELALRAAQVAISLLLVLIALNVAVLVYARTATRAGEIAVRTALGASRARVVSQLFVEALVLSLIAAAAGLAISLGALGIVRRFQERMTGDELPFFIDLGLSPSVVGYVIALAVLAGVIVGVLPGLKATAGRVQAGLQQLTSRGSSLRLGHTWTVFIVVQVAIAVAVLPFAINSTIDFVRSGTREPGYPAHEIMRAMLSLEREESPPAAEAAAYEAALEQRFEARATELLRRLHADPAVSGVTFASHFPGTAPFARIEVDRVNAAGETLAAKPGAGVGGSALSVQLNRIDIDLFTVFDVPILAGRSFSAGDAREDATAVIVNEVLAQRIAGGGDVLGRRVRSITRNGDGEIESGPWMEIVGVVPEFTQSINFGATAKLYLPITPAHAPTVLALAVRFPGTPAPGFARRLREVAASVDPGLQLHEVRGAAEVQRLEQQGILYAALVIVGVTASVLLLSAAGIYAMMSFTVARRRREIGIRAALGADPRRLLGGVFARAAAQLGAGVLGGLVLATGAILLAGDQQLARDLVFLVPLVAATISLVGLAAALGPARRGLAVQPSEALRSE